MKISGFSFVRNGVRLYYPVVESIKSILPICHEFVVAVGKGDPDDTTRVDIAAIDDPKIRIIDTDWDQERFQRGSVHARQTDLAKEACTGDWCFYLQADEVVHERDLAVIQRRCEELVDDEEVEGLLFQYRHFWGDYRHYHRGHGWYPNEIRIVRNLPEIHSWESAQSFRYFLEYRDPRQQEDTRKLQVAEAGAEILHYGWVRPPERMQQKNKEFKSIHWGKNQADDFYQKAPKHFDYGPLNMVREYEGSHPRVMQDRIEDFHWEDQLQYTGTPNPHRKKHKHEQLKYKILEWIERALGIEHPPWTFKNYQLLRGK